MRASSGGYGLWLVVLVGVTLGRLILAGFVPLAPDEAYYRIWALAPAAGYLDHPPMVALWMRLGLWLGGDTPVGLRLMGPVSAAIGSCLLVKAGAYWQRAEGAGAARNAGLRAAIMLNATLALGLGTLIMTPDTPLVFFMTVLVWSLSRLCADEAGWWWLVAGAALGLGFDSKYTALLPAAGVAVWLCVNRQGRRWLRTPWPWCAALVGTVCVSPVMWWNATHHWASFLKQGGRTADWQPGRMLTFLGELLGGQVGLASPLLFGFFAGGAIVLWRRRDGFSALLFWMILCPAVVFIQHALGARVQANWPVVVYPVLALAASPLVSRWWKSAIAVGVGMTALIVIQAVATPLRLAPHWDVTLRQLGGWRDFGQVVARAAPPGLPLMADEYGLAGELAFYAPARSVVAVEPRWSLFALPRPPCGQEGYLIRSHKRQGAPDPGVFEVMSDLSVSLARARHGVVAETYGMVHVRLRCDGGPLVPDAARLPAK
ncbi:glycosyltransferase family 39 protein [Acetobacter sp. TBRC 12305]|uniref:Glycosyltransferase family 39 protein n=1 Tax=Acetobacter garciniae TaxID=2817435 RepID=A0A939HP15_9PROT|nr:glycosyltransferase family 39 protein [Acetobacter garciniae]MBO1325896.1 glycosyltransferase family 39 protein [Acetobacter garciniae]MBX0345796.1 glycosyltransferase family 39 protein [Acetobacter garciniae]